MIAGNKEELEQLRAENARLRLRIEMFAWKRRNWKAGRFCRFGFRRDPDRPGILVGHPPDIDIIRLIMRLYADGKSSYLIWKQLNAMTFAHREKKFPRSLIANIVRRSEAGEYSIADSS